MTDRGGTALPAAMAALALAAALAAAVADIARIEVLVARSRWTAAAALAAGDACLAEVVAGLAPGWDFGALLAGPDGFLAAPPGCRASARAAPGPADPARAVVTVEGDVSGGRRVLDALVGRDVAPGVPALVWLSRAPVGGALAGMLRLDGGDAGDPTAPDQAGLAAPVDASALDAWAANEGAHLATTARTAPAITASPPPLADLTSRLRAAGPAGAEILVPGTAPPPVLAYVAGDLNVAGALHGAGLLLVDGVLDVSGTLDFSGVLVAAGGVRVGSGARLSIAGALWIGAPAVPGQALLVTGDLIAQQDRAAVAAADRLLGLPRRAVVLGLRDLG